MESEVKKEEQNTAQQECDAEEKPAEGSGCAGEKTAEDSGSAEEKPRRKRKALCILAGCAAAVLLAYLGAGLYFDSHYFFRTEINGHDMSGKTAAQAEAILKEDVAEYRLTLLEIDGGRETIAGADVGLVFEGAEGLQDILDAQDSLLWVRSLSEERKEEVDIRVSCDSAKLKECIGSLQAVTGEQKPGTSAYPKFDGAKFVVEPEKYGTAVEREALEQRIEEALLCLEERLDLEEAGCYEAPPYTSESEEVKAACEKMNQYCSAKVVYPMDEDVVVDASVISGWLKVNKKMKVSIDEDAIRLWLEDFGNRYDTQGTTRTFTTPEGRETTVKGGTYGWSVNEKAEFDILLDAVKKGKTLEKDPEYYSGGTAAAHAMPDWGNTYVDVDLSRQHIWYIKDGETALETDVVTGHPNTITPEGTYSILEKARDQVLIGSEDPATGEPSYRTPVSYWMRVTWSGIGFHDATWQPDFGGSLNEIAGRGSHGCINMPLDQAAALYEMLEVGTPVVIHY